MEVRDKYYWDLVSIALQDLLNKVSVENWNKSEIEYFIFDSLIPDVKQKCENNHKLAEVCRIPFVKGRYQFDQLSFSYDSFRRIFKTKESLGNRTSKVLFAIYLGYTSYEKCLESLLDKYYGDIKVIKEDQLYQYFDGRKVTSLFLDLVNMYIEKWGSANADFGRRIVREFDLSDNTDSIFHKYLRGLFAFHSLEYNRAYDLIKECQDIFENHYQLHFIYGRVIEKVITREKDVEQLALLKQNLLDTYNRCLNSITGFVNPSVVAHIFETLANYAIEDEQLDRAQRLLEKACLLRGRGDYVRAKLVVLYARNNQRGDFWAFLSTLRQDGKTYYSVKCYLEEHLSSYWV